MNDGPLVTSQPGEARPSKSETDPGRTTEGFYVASKLQKPPASTAETQASNINANRSNGTDNTGKSDSEAETVVLSGKEDGGQETKAKKAIKLEEPNGMESSDAHSPKHVSVNQTSQSVGSRGSDIRQSSLKRKRKIPDQCSDNDTHDDSLSLLSSTVSSPILEAHSSKATDTASNRSRSSPPIDEITQRQEEPTANKSRLENSNIRIDHRIDKRDRGSERGIARKRRDTRSATHYDGPSHRSESPPSRTNTRAQSIHSALPPSGVTKRRKVPAPLHVERRRKASEDTHQESDDDSSIHSHQHIQKLTSVDTSAMSPAKMVSHKKNRDRNGRTLLARACAQGVKEAEQSLKDRPEDLDIPDNAGNTPLQIAALEGDIEVVQLLLDAGCDTTCKNIDKDTPLIDAIENGHLEVVKLLLKAGLDPRQTNAKGAEPTDLIPMDHEDANEIRAALVASKQERSANRRPSEDNRLQTIGSKDMDMATASVSGISPVNSNRSPPPGLGPRRRTARSQPTDDALLWVNATPARLRDAAGKGDVTIVDHILKMKPQADTETIIAAARGGHWDVLQLIIALANPNPDPEPLRSGEYPPAYSTPMLAAIGRGNISIIELLLSASGFDPTRRMYNGMTYFELAKERQAPEWQEEYDVLKKAYDDYKQQGGRRSNHSSPRKVRTKQSESTKPISELSSSPHEVRRPKKTGILRDENSDRDRRGSSDVRRHRSPALASDRESEPLGPPKAKTKAKEDSSPDDKRPLPSKRTDSLKPKSRLMSGNEIKRDQEMKRRASLAAEADFNKRTPNDTNPDSHVRRRRLSDTSESRVSGTPGEASNINDDLSKKRHRTSVSPQASKSDLGTGIDVTKMKKRQRINSQGSAADPGTDHPFRSGPSAMVANMVPNPVNATSPTIPHGTAPVAFMGSNIAPQAIISPVDTLVQSSTVPSMHNVGSGTEKQGNHEDMQPPNPINSDHAKQEIVWDEHHRQVIADQQLSQMEDNRRRQAKLEQEQAAKAEREENERKIREEEQARREAQEAQRKLRMEQEQEEARISKLKRDEELNQRRLEHERLRREEQERKRREMEERENLRRQKLREEEEQRRLESLPNCLRRVASLPQEIAKSEMLIKHWLPLNTVETRELDPSCDPQVAEEKWIANVQAAPILAIKDLELSQFTAWSRFPATINHRGSLWRVLHLRLGQDKPQWEYTWAEMEQVDIETRRKFFRLTHVFWIKLSDFMDIVPRHQHLAKLKISTRAMVLHEFPFGKGNTWDTLEKTQGLVKQEANSPTTNGPTTNGY